MYPFDCSICRKRVYAPSKRLASCCEDAIFYDIVNICLMIPAKVEPTFHVVNTIPENTPLPAPSGTKLVSACNSPKLPKFTTGSEVAVTCYKCKQWMDLSKKKVQIQKEQEALESLLDGVEFVDEENPENSFKAKVQSVKKIDPSSLTHEKSNEILDKLKSLHDEAKKRKMLFERQTMLQELDSK
jgi:hypothetical protein